MELRPFFRLQNGLGSFFFCRAPFTNFVRRSVPFVPPCARWLNFLKLFCQIVRGGPGPGPQRICGSRKGFFFFRRSNYSYYMGVSRGFPRRGFLTSVYITRYGSMYKLHPMIACAFFFFFFFWVLATLYLVNANVLGHKKESGAPVPV